MFSLCVWGVCIDECASPCASEGQRAARSLTGIWRFPVRLGWLTIEPQRSPMTVSPELGLHACTPTSGFFPGGLGIEFGSSHVLWAGYPFDPGFLSLFRSSEGQSWGSFRGRRTRPESQSWENVSPREELSLADFKGWIIRLADG